MSVQQGTLATATVNNASSNGPLGNSANAVSLGNTGSVSGTLQYTGATASSTKTFTMANGGTGVFQIDNSAANLGVGAVGGSGNLTKTGAGTLTVAGTNTYGGATTVSNGTLQVNGTLATSGVTVANGASLQGTSGNLGAGSVTVHGTITPGDGTNAGLGSISTLTSTGTETWSSDGKYAVGMTKAVAGGSSSSTTPGTDQDSLVMASLTLGSGFTVQPITETGFSTGFNPTTSNNIYEWVIAHVTSGSITGPLSNVTFDTSLFSSVYNQSYHFSLFSQPASGGQDIVLKYDYNMVPEATTLLLGMVGLAPILLHRRRRIGHAAAPRQ